ncbi:MAG: BON domain-containing protein [Blastocatellia bacterium]
MNAEYQYLIGRLQDALATDPRVNALDVKITVCGGRIHLTGEVATEERRGAAALIVAELAPEIEIRNELTVYAISQAAEPEAIHA